MGEAKYDPCNDIRRHIAILFKDAFEGLGGIGFGGDDEIDEALWKEAVDEILHIVKTETLSVRLLNYLGRLYFVVASLREQAEGQIMRELKRKYWISLLDEFSLNIDRNRTIRVRTFTQALSAVEQNLKESEIERSIVRKRTSGRGD